MDPSLAISILALGLSAVSITIQAVQWKRSGPVVRVKVGQAFLTYHGGGVSDAMVNVEAHNDGRSAVTVTNWGIEFPSGDGLVTPVQMPGASPLPHRLESGANAVWWVPTDEIVRTCKEHGLPHQRTRAYVRLASGEKVYANRRGIGLK